MKTVTKLDAQSPAVKPRKRVAAYARVSRETERLQHSLSAQISYYNDMIQKNPDWIFAGVYVDDGISGTSTAKRQDFNRMIEDAEAGKIDIILTKSISRFARNTVDLLKTVRQLKEIGVEVRFERENIHSLSGDGELMLSILASFAQEESLNISYNTTWGIRKLMEKGAFYNHSRIYGYRWEGDDLVPVPEEAAVVKRIYQNFLEGKSKPETERELTADGITTRDGGRWSESSIRRILTNVTYTGNILLQKSYTVNPITKSRKVNRGELPQYFMADTHEAIIDKETFDWVQAEILRRRNSSQFRNGSLNPTFLTGKIKCGCCGRSYVHSQQMNNAQHTMFPGVIEKWSCTTRKRESGSCPGKQILHRIVLQEIRKALGTDEIDENVFSERIDHITVTGARELTFHFRDGHQTVQLWINKSKKDMWTEEARNRMSAYLRSHPAPGKKGASCFTCMIKCGACGNNYQKQIRHNPYGDVSIWQCATRKNNHAACSMCSIRDEVMKELICKVLELETFDPGIFLEKVEHVTITGKGTLTVFLKDGTTRDMTFSTKKRMPPATEEFRRKRSEAMKARFTPEYRQQMSERMKQLRKERGKNWQKA